MLSRIIFCTAVFLAALSALLLAIFSLIAHRNHNSNTPVIALCLYIQQPVLISSSNSNNPTLFASDGALIFHRVLTVGPENTFEVVVGGAHGFLVPLERFAHLAFNIICLTFHTKQFSGSLSIQPKNLEHKEVEELKVVSGTGYFAFARGLAVFAKTNSLQNATYHVKMNLEFPNKSHTVPR